MRPRSVVSGDRPRLFLALGAALSLACSSCVDDAAIRVRTAPGFTPGQANVSVLGVYKDGRMSVDAWQALSVAVSAALGSAQVCEPAFGVKLQREDEPLFASLDDQTKDEGITEDLLAKLAPSADGDVILALTSRGSVGLTTGAGDKTPSISQTPPPTTGMGGGRLGGARAAAHREPTPRGPAPKVFELSATLFSAKQRAPLARLTMAYTGNSLDEAVRDFSAELGKLMPRSTCKGWSWPKKTALPDAVAPILQGP